MLCDRSTDLTAARDLPVYQLSGNLLSQNLLDTWVAMEHLVLAFSSGMNPAQQMQSARSQRVDLLGHPHGWSASPL